MLTIGTSDPYLVVRTTPSTGIGKIEEEGRSPHVSSTLNPDFKSMLPIAPFRCWLFRRKSPYCDFE
jgi:hypothetical protein